uniref:Kelch repeat-containing protein n=2 Tax=Tetraselmis sp. GSL018 TaxID=582737 RepID=A0A061SHW3_9CHLO
MIYSSVQPEWLLDDLAGRCPVVESKRDGDLVAYYRFNEGAVRNQDGELSPDLNAWAAKDSSGQGNDGFVGLLSDETAQNKDMSLRCTEGYVITEILFANYGANRGGYGTFERDGCGASNSMSYIEDRCLGRRSCKIHAAYSVFGNPCRKSSKTLAVNAICGLAQGGEVRSPWAIGDPAPHWVGTTAPPQITCPYSISTELSTNLNTALPNKTCNEWNITTAVAGEPEYFLLRLMDKCGYRNRYPKKIGDYITLIDTTIPALEPGDEHEPVFETDISGFMRYPIEYVQPQDDTCDMLVVPQAERVYVDFLWPGHSLNGYDTYCSRFRDQYLGMYTPVVANRYAQLSLNLAKVYASVFAEITVDVAPAALNVSMSSVCGPGEVAPLCAGPRCEDISAEAGVEAMFELVARDAFGNQLRDWADLSRLSLYTAGGNGANFRVLPGREGGVYNFHVIFPHEGVFTISPVLEGARGCGFNAHVSPPQPREVVDQYGVVPPARFEHSMVEYRGDLYLFGGIAEDKSYFSDTWVLRTKYQRHAQGFHYRRAVKVSGLELQPPASSYIVQLDLPTAAWMQAGKLKADCADLLLLDSRGSRVRYWLEPRGAPNGCGTNQARLWVMVPMGEHSLQLYYGNKGFASYSSPDVFSLSPGSMFEDFEYAESPLDNGWELGRREHDTCTPLEPRQFGDPMSFMATKEVSLSGERSLAVDAKTRIGGTIRKPGPQGLGNSFILKGFMYDTMCLGYHYLSPDFDLCQPVDNAKSLLPDCKNALGIYTDSKHDQYCHTYPWVKSGHQRHVGWHSLEFVGDEQRVRLFIDDMLVGEKTPTQLSELHIAGGMFLSMEDVPGSKVYWDSLLVTPNLAGVEAEYSGNEEAIYYDEELGWQEAGLVRSAGDLPPPARQGHTAVKVNRSMYVFGGERSLYPYSDIWRYDFEYDEWRFLDAVNSSMAIGRYDHSAVVYDNAIYIYGGRTHETKRDFWKFDLETLVWIDIPVLEEMSPRHGHGAAVLQGKMYVYGGWQSRWGERNSDGMLSDEIWSYEFSTGEWVKLGPRKDNYVEPHMADPQEAMQFPQNLPPARYAFVLLGRSSSSSFYIVGGAGGNSPRGLLGDVVGFSAEARQWSAPLPLKPYSALLERLDAAGSLIDGMWACVYGGLQRGYLMNNTICTFVGEMGIPFQTPSRLR